MLIFFQFEKDARPKDIQQLSNLNRMRVQLTISKLEVWETHQVLVTVLGKLDLQEMIAASDVLCGFQQSLVSKVIPKLVILEHRE